MVTNKRRRVTTTMNH